MKTTKFTKFLTGLALLFLFACQEQEIQQLETAQEEQFLETANFSMRAMDRSELSSGIVSRFIELNSEKNKSTGKENGDDLEIDWDNGNYMQLGSQHSYTFAVFPKESDNKLRNIVYVSLYSGGYHEYLYTYDLTVEELQLFNEGDAPDLSGKITIEFLGKLDKLPSTGKASGDCGYKGWVGTDQYGIKRIYTHRDNCEDNIGLGQCKWEDKTYPCPETLDDGNSNNNSSGGGNSSDSGSSSDPIIFIPRGVSGGGPNPTGIFDSGSGSPSGGGGGSGGSFSAPLPMTKAFYLASDLNLDINSFEAKWLNQNQAETDRIYSFMLRLNKNDIAIEEAKLDIAIKTRNSFGLRPQSGKIANNDALEYTDIDTGFDNGTGTLYKLKNGIFIARYATKRGINGGTVHDQDLSLSFDGNFYYAYNPDQENDYGVVNGHSLGWYELVISQNNDGIGFENAFIDALLDGSKFVGRYVLPVEDVLIMIDGKDFDGVEQSRVAAAGFFVVGLIPGGKITKAFKPIAKVVKGTEAWGAIAKAGDKTISFGLKKSGEAFDILKNARSKAGKATGSGVNIKDTWLRGTERNAGFFPKSIADKMRNKNYSNFEDFKKDFWKNIANDAEASKQFKNDAASMNEMRNGRAPFANASQQLNCSAARCKKYNIHHQTPINQGGSVYDVDNLIIVTPRYHKEILDPKYHYGYGY